MDNCVQCSPLTSTNASSLLATVLWRATTFFSHTLSDSLACLRHLCSRLSPVGSEGACWQLEAEEGKKSQVLHVFCCVRKKRTEESVNPFTRAIIHGVFIAWQLEGSLLSSLTPVSCLVSCTFEIRKSLTVAVGCSEKSENCYSQKNFLVPLCNQFRCDTQCPRPCLDAL